MIAKPILFSAPMIRALLDGRKTQTRRVVKAQPGNPNVVRPYQRPDGQWTWVIKETGVGGSSVFKCPYGNPGDLLWARETHGYPEHRAKIRQREWAEKYGCWYRATDRYGSAMVHGPMCSLHWCGRWRPSIHMPRWASRITLHLTDVRVERVQDISTEDAKAEGCNPYMPGEGIIEPPTHPDEHQYRPDYWRGFSVLWDSLNAKRGYGWDANPWVWSLTFRPILANVDDVLADPGRYGVPA